MNRFDLSERNFLVYTPVQERSLDFFKELARAGTGSLHKLDDLPRRLRAAITKDDTYSNNDHYYVSKAKSKDQFSAAHKMLRSYERRTATSVLGSRGFQIQFRPYAFVIDQVSDELTPVQTEQSHLQVVQSRIRQSQAKILIEDGHRIITSFDQMARRRVIAANDTVSLVRSESDSETQVSILWSAFEALLGDPLDSKSRIAHFVSQIAPAVCLNYPWRYSNAVYQQIHIHHRRFLKDILNKAKIEPVYPLDACVTRKIPVKRNAPSRV